jgi:hypothetical protein
MIWSPTRVTGNKFFLPLHVAIRGGSYEFQKVSLGSSMEEMLENTAIELVVIDDIQASKDIFRN